MRKRKKKRFNFKSKQIYFSWKRQDKLVMSSLLPAQHIQYLKKCENIKMVKPIKE